MWARRCGAPKRYPSRVKVIIFSLFSGTIGLSIYMYMAGSNISYLDLSSPASEEVTCLVDWPLRRHAVAWSAPQEWLAWWVRQVDRDREELLAAQTCRAPGVDHTPCRTVLAPVDDMKRPLALAVGHLDDLSTRYDVLGLWARFFLLITFFIWIGMTTHDLALIGPVEKDFILDVAGVNAHCPVIRSVWRCLAGYRPLVRLVSKEQWYVRMLGFVLAVVLAPLLLAWNVVVFNFVIVPLLMLAFARYPIRMSRAWVFIVCLTCCLYGLALTIVQVAFLVSPASRPCYAVTWQPESPAAPEPLVVPTAGNVTGPALGPCTCGCEYRVSRHVCVNLLVVGVGTTLKSLFVALRCLKGLRRSQWASLLSVVFPVPVTVYSVQWRQSNGQPIRFRTEGQAVQDEIAFDPFAMMDEQSDSAFTTVHLRPEPVHTYRRGRTGELTLVNPRRTMQMPSKPMPPCQGIEIQDVEYIGCCGFPWPTGGQKGVYQPDLIAQLESLVEESSPCSRATRTPNSTFGGAKTFSRIEDIFLSFPPEEPTLPHGSGEPGVTFAPPPPPPKPRDHAPPRWDAEAEVIGAVCVCCDLGPGVRAPDGVPRWSLSDDGF